MASGVAVIKVRGSSEVEVNKKYSVTNSLNSTRSAVEEWLCCPVCLYWMALCPR